MPSYFQKGGGTAHTVCFPVFVPPSHLSHIVRNLLEKQGKIHLYRVLDAVCHNHADCFSFWDKTALPLGCPVGRPL